jgi:hypothetical protein
MVFLLNNEKSFFIVTDSNFLSYSCEMCTREINKIRKDEIEGSGHNLVKFFRFRFEITLRIIANCCAIRFTCPSSVV